MNNKMRLIIVLLFAITFTVTGTLAPVVYATYVPADSVIEGHSFVAEDVSTQADSHLLCFNRTVHRASTGRVFMELYILNESNDRVRTEIAVDTQQRYFQLGHQLVVTEQPLPDVMTTGEYKYVLIVRLQMAGGRVTRQFAFESNVFNVTDGVPEESRDRQAFC